MLAEESALWDMTRALSHPDFPECFQLHGLPSMIRFVPENKEGVSLQVSVLHGTESK